MATALNRRSAIRWSERAVLSLAIVFFCAHDLPRAWQTLNTDFPNYYIAARLVREGYDTSRIYEWRWIEREKDHRGIDIPVIGLLPITPFSTLVMYPLAFFDPLTAKRIWILLNLAFLLPIGWILKSLTQLNYRWIALALLLNFPLYRNLLYGQFYIFLLLLLLTACLCYLRGKRAVAGSLVGIAAVCKVFPLLLFVVFLRRRDWRSLTAGMVTGTAAITLSCAVFGINVHRTWLEEILPWVMRGEGLGTYRATPSISGVLHYLFLSEPQWNPHPWHTSLLAYALLASVLQIVLLAPAILLVRHSSNSSQRVPLEWSAMLTAALTISTIPASYNFVLMVFPVCVVASILIREKRYGWLSALVIAYLGIGFPIRVPERPLGLMLFLYIPRLPLMIAVLLGIFGLLWRENRKERSEREWGHFAWITVMVVLIIVSARSTFHIERAERNEYAYRVPLKAQGLLNATPEIDTDRILYIAFRITGYRLVSEGSNEIHSDVNAQAPFDELSFATGPGDALVEYASVRGSQIFDLQYPFKPPIDDASQPMPSKDGQNLAFLRDNHGRAELMLRRHFGSSTEDLSLTPSHLNVYEASFSSEKEYAFSAREGSSMPEIYVVDDAHKNATVKIGSSRYPALSPDGKWLVYSHFEHGFWNLWLLDRSRNFAHRVAEVPCNQVEPSWEGDSKAILYSTDCGRSVWFTAVARRTVVP